MRDRVVEPCVRVCWQLKFPFQAGLCDTLWSNLRSCPVAIICDLVVGCISTFAEKAFGADGSSISTCCLGTLWNELVKSVVRCRAWQVVNESGGERHHAVTAWLLMLHPNGWGDPAPWLYRAGFHFCCLLHPPGPMSWGILEVRGASATGCLCCG